MSSFKKLFAILELFTKEKTSWTAEEINEQLGFTRPTGYRYMKELCDYGLLSRLSGGTYVLGPKIIELDYIMRNSDPLISIAKPIMKEIQMRTGCDVLLGYLYNEQVVIVHEEQPAERFSNRAIERGIYFSLFKGATSRVIIANLPRNQLLKLYNKYKETIANCNLGNSWDEFRSKMTKIRQQGHDIAHNEFRDGMTGISAPIFNQYHVRGSLTLGMPTERFFLFDQKKLVDIVVDAAKRITLEMNEKQM